MKTRKADLAALLAVALAGLCLAPLAHAKLPPPTPAQQEAAAKKKEQAKAEEARQKKALAERMDVVTERWRQRAAENDWPTHPPTAVEPVAGIDATTSQSSPSGQPGGKQGEAAGQKPVRSEKSGTAPPSPDAKPDNPVSIRAPQPK